MAFQRSIPVQLEAGETVERNLRRHGIILVGRLLPPAIVLCAPLLLVFWSLLPQAADPTHSSLLFRYSLTALLVIGVPVIIWGIINTFDWANDSFHITNRRVIRSEVHFWISSQVKSAELRQIQNIAVVIPDLLANILNYGTVVIETAAQAGKIEFDSIHNPHAIQRLLFELRGIPLPPDEPAGPPAQSWHDVLRAVFPFAPQEKPDGSIVYHKHWYILVQHMSLPVALILFVVAGAWLLSSWLPFVLLLGLIPMLVYQYVNWINDVYILTTNRIIDIYKIPLIREDRREALLEQIQNVQVTIPNFGSRLLDMGDVFVETAGKAENFMFKTVHHPGAVAQELNRRLDGVRSNRRQAESLARRQEIETILTQILQTQQGQQPPSGAPPTQV